jgi:Holliday junction resolvase RusA-like endonuclease
MIYLEAFIPGTPRPKDFHAARRGRRGGVFLLPSHRSLQWQKLLTDTLRTLSERPGVPLDLPARLRLVFCLPVPKRRRESLWASGRPDLDKLCRAVLDALQKSGWLVDDSRVVSLEATKSLRPVPGVSIRLEAADSSLCSTWR